MSNSTRVEWRSLGPAQTQRLTPSEWGTGSATPQAVTGERGHLRSAVVHHLPHRVSLCVRPSCPTPPRVVPAVHPLRSTTPRPARAHGMPPPPPTHTYTRMQKKKPSKGMKVEEIGGEWRKKCGGGGWGNSGHSTRDVGCGGLWRDVVEENGMKMGGKWDEIPIFHRSVLPILPEIEDLPHPSICKNQVTGAVAAAVARA